MQTIKLPFDDEQSRVRSMQALAELVRQGVTFDAEVEIESGEQVVTVTFTGGF